MTDIRPPSFKLAIAQLNPCVGDIGGNVSLLEAAHKAAARQGADLLIAPESCVTGYPIEDLALNRAFLRKVRAAVEELARSTLSAPALLIGAPWLENDQVYNAALLLSDGRIIAEVFKRELPNYGPFAEKRVYASGPLRGPVEWRGTRLGIMVCEDMWKPDVTRSLRDGGARIMLVLNGSPYEEEKQTRRLALARERVRESGAPLIYVNQMGGQDDLVFDGASFAMDASGEIVAQCPAWETSQVIIDWQGNGLKATAPLAVLPEGPAGNYCAIMTGLRDYVRKNGFSSVWLGLSGGIDSALVAALAADALGADKVRCVMMPSPVTSTESRNDAEAVASALGCRLDTVSIEKAMESFAETLSPLFAGRAADVTEENIQARCRGVLLMAMSNKFGGLVLATGNKSEMAMGYSTLYGDMCGGYAPLKDAYKTEVYRMARWRNANRPAMGLGAAGEVIARNILVKPPTAELRVGQTDQDTLPPYDLLDEILSGLVEQDLSADEVIARGHDAAVVRGVAKSLRFAEHKRRQSPPGPKITGKHLGADRKYPITRAGNA